MSESDAETQTGSGEAYEPIHCSVCNRYHAAPPCLGG